MARSTPGQPSRSGPPGHAACAWLPPCRAKHRRFAPGHTHAGSVPPANHCARQPRRMPGLLPAPAIGRLKKFSFSLSGTPGCRDQVARNALAPDREARAARATVPCRPNDTCTQGEHHETTRHDRRGPGQPARAGRRVHAGPGSGPRRRQGKCYGVAKAGQNDCASPGSAHACAGQSKIDKDPMSWKFVPAGTCTQMGGMLQQPSK